MRNYTIEEILVGSIIRTSKGLGEIVTAEKRNDTYESNAYLVMVNPCDSLGNPQSSAFAYYSTIQVGE